MAEMIARTRQKDYPIRIRTGLLGEIGENLEANFRSRRILVLSDENVAPLYQAKVLRSLYQAGIQTASLTLPAGEASKSPEALNRLYTALFMSDIGKRDALLALGGGVIVQLAGVAAATYLRGIRLIQAPTSLFAQIDSAVGGRSTINMPFAADAVGLCYLPFMVCSDPSSLRSLPPEEMQTGMAEAVRCALIRDANLFERLERRSVDLEWLVRRCVGIKTEILRGDTDSGRGEHRLLNFGKPMADAVLRLGHEADLHWGEALELGMLLTAGLGECAGRTEAGTMERLRQVLTANGLRRGFDGLEAGLLADSLRRAARLSQGGQPGQNEEGQETISLVLLEHVGRVCQEQFGYERLERMLEDLLHSL